MISIKDPQRNILFISWKCSHLYLTFPGTVFRVFSDFRTSARCQGNRWRGCYGDPLQCICYLVRYLFNEWTFKNFLLVFVNDSLCHLYLGTTETYSVIQNTIIILFCKKIILCEKKSCFVTLKDFTWEYTSLSAWYFSSFSKVVPVCETNYNITSTSMIINAGFFFVNTYFSKLKYW